LRRPRDHCFEDWLHLRRRSADDFQDFGSRGLLLERLIELVGALLLGLEQPYVLECDHCLVGELLEQSFVHVRDRPGLGPADHNDTQRVTVA
jgi:hypothetical protein